MISSFILKPSGISARPRLEILGGTQSGQPEPLFFATSDVKNKMCTAPTSSLSPLSLSAPTTKSLTPLPFRSPMCARPVAKESPADNVGPLSVELLISIVESTEPPSFRNKMCTAPVYDSSPRAPTAKSLTPLPSMSPIFATEAPKRSSSDNVGPFVVVPSITTVAFARPFPGSSSMNKMYTAPVATEPPPRLRFAPTAKSS